VLRDEDKKTFLHSCTNGIDRNKVHVSRIARHSTGKPICPPAHVAMIVLEDGPKWTGVLKDIAPGMISDDLIPFIYISYLNVKRYVSSCLGASRL
jgi:hypothetical protein